MIVRAADRFRTSQPGIESWHVLSAGPHYDPTRLRAGPLIGIDEHVLAPGAGFAEHAHRGVEIVSWIVSGALAHSSGDENLVLRPGQVLVQRAGRGIRHVEANASASEPLRLVQLTLLRDGDAPSTEVVSPPVVLEQATIVPAPAAPAWVYVIDGFWSAAGAGPLGPGDFAWITEPPEGAGELLSWCVRSDAWTQSISGV